MITPPKCFLRKCKHYVGIQWMGSRESTERPVCPAFPEGIPDEIAYGDNLHEEPLPEQDNNIVFEEA